MMVCLYSERCVYSLSGMYFKLFLSLMLACTLLSLPPCPPLSISQAHRRGLYLWPISETAIPISYGGYITATLSIPVIATCVVH